MRKIFLVLLSIANISFIQANLAWGLMVYYRFNDNANYVKGDNKTIWFNDEILSTCRFRNTDGVYHFGGITNYIQIPILIKKYTFPTYFINSLQLSPKSNHTLIYNWIGPNRFTSIQQNPAIINRAKTLNYTYKVTDEVNNCTESVSQSIFSTQRCTDTNSIGNIINTYTPVTSLDPCTNEFTVEDASTFNQGDTVLIIQMKGVIIDTSNTASFGMIADYRNSGNYEFNYVKSKTGNTIELQNNLTRSYNIPDGKVQLIRVPYYDSITVTDNLTCLPWDGNKGGVLVLNAKNSITLNADINVSGQGFRGGANGNIINVNSEENCSIVDYNFPSNSYLAAPKGEGITTVSNNIMNGRGALANGGGGGNGQNSGGGGGGNAGIGGSGGYQYGGCPDTPFANGGNPGKNIVYSTVLNKIYMGGGGGAGNSNNLAGFQPNAGSGGGIVIIQSPILNNNNFSIIANGTNGTGCIPDAKNDNCNDGMGGGGAGGSILINALYFDNNISIDALGGNGADVNFYQTNTLGLHGPGGGGSGGIIWLNTATIPTVASINTSGGKNGVNIDYDKNTWGATAGNDGTAFFNLKIPVDSVPFKKNIDSVSIQDSFFCNKFYFKGLAYTAISPVTLWEWSFDDGTNVNAQNASHTFSSAGNHNIKLLSYDSNGCSDSAVTSIIVTTFHLDAGNDSIVCKNKPFQLNGSGDNIIQYAWTPALFLNDSTLQNPIATINATTNFYLTGTNAAGCTWLDSVKISVRPTPEFTISPDSSVCSFNFVQLFASGGDIYLWSPASLVSNPYIPDPLPNTNVTTTYSVLIKESACSNSTILTTTLTLAPPIKLIATKSNDLDCSNGSAKLLVTGATLYSWSPGNSLNDSSIANPIASPLNTQQYIVKGSNFDGCSGYDTIIVYANYADSSAGYYMPNAFTPNGDGLNDCYGIKYWGLIEKIDFTIYDRWGNKVFYSNDPNACWDGIYRGQPANAAGYVYYISAITACGHVERKGTFVLVR